MPRRIMAVFVALVLVPGQSSRLAAAERLGRDGFITRPGTYRANHGKMTVRIFEGNGKLKSEINYKCREDSIKATWTIGPLERFSEKGGAKWFVYVESPRSWTPKSFWVFDGHEVLRRTAYDPEGNPMHAVAGTTYSYDERSAARANVPDAVRDRLPKAFKNKFVRMPGAGNDRIAHSTPGAKIPARSASE